MKLQKYIISFLSAAAFTVTPAAAQNVEMREVKGVVVDAADHSPIPGVQVQALGNNQYAAMTDAQGTFTIKVPAYETALYVQTSLYQAQQVAIGKQGSVQVQLINDRFRPMYENGTTLTAASKTGIESKIANSFETDIQDQLGADVHSISRNGGPGYGNAMFVRGLSTLNSNSQPLIVVDGVIRDMQQMGSALHEGEFDNLLLNINPADVESVQVLKNATALYGARGGAGAILINTKRGRSMATRIDANIGGGFTLMSKLPDMMDASAYRVYASELLGTYDRYKNYEGTLNFLNDDPSKYYYHQYHNDTDWKDEVYRTAFTQNYNINVQGGDERGMYNLSLGYTDAQSTGRKQGFNRLNVRFNTDIIFLPQLKTRFDLSYTKVNRDVFDNGVPADLTAGTVTSASLLALIKSPLLSPYKFNSVTGEMSNTFSPADDLFSELDENLSLGNPTQLLNNDGVNKNRAETTLFNAVVAPTWDISKYFSLSETFSYTLDRISARYYRPKDGMPGFVIDGIGRVEDKRASSYSKETSISSDTRLSFKRIFGAHKVSAFAGMRFLSFDFDETIPTGQNESGGNDTKPNLNNGVKYKEITGSVSALKSVNWYLNADYNWRNRYFAQVAVSMESTNRFGSEATALKLGGVSWGVFPSVQVGWVLTNESWFPKTTAVNYVKIHGGFDISGNDDFPVYADHTYFSVQKFAKESSAAVLDNIGNDNLTYERTSKLNMGLTTWLLNNRLGINLDVYKHHTSDLLVQRNISNPIAGLKTYWDNGGSLDNKGFEVSVTGKPVVSKNFAVELGASMGHYQNTVKKLSGTQQFYVDGKPSAKGILTSVYGTENIATIKGRPIGLFYGYRTAGVFATDAEAKAAGKNGYLYQTTSTGAHENFNAGDVHFMDLNGDGEISEADKTVIGDPNPDIYGNIFARATWKNFTLHVGFNYSLGNDVYNYQRSVIESGSTFYNQTTAIENRWRNEGQRTDVPRAVYGDPKGNNRFSDRWIEDGSYLRLKTVSLTYKVPVNSSWLQGLSIWAEANNLVTLTHYLGGDPEFSASNSVLYQGIDPGNIYLGRNFSMGLKINL